MIRDVNITISRQTKAVTQAGFGLPLILSVSKEHPYTQYMELSSVAEDFPETTEEYKIAARMFGQSPSPQRIAIGGIEYTGVPSDLVAALNSFEGEFYFVVSPEQGMGEVEAISSWVDAQKKMYFVSTDDRDMPTMFESDRTVFMIHNNPETYPAEGWVGRCAPTLPGSITWKFKTINGILEGGTSITEDIQAKENGANTYIRQGGILMAVEGVTSSGEFIDVIRSQDFVEARMKENVFRVLAVTDKVPFTDKGINLIGSEVETTLKTAYNQGIIADDEDGNPLYTITLPKREDVPTNDRANRTLPDVRFEFILAGAIHQVRIDGVIKV